eukprot:SAG31_NODE_2784_length_5092_cov_10.113158_7_plen_346_part_00
MDMIAGHNLRDAGAPDPRSELPRGPGSLIAKRVQTQFSMIAVTGAVLLFSDDPRDARNDHLLQIVANEDIIAVHQDPPTSLGYARRLFGGALAGSIKELRTSRLCADRTAARWRWRANATAPGTGAFESVSRPGWCLSTSSGNGPNKCGSQMAALMPCGPSVLGSYCGPIDQWRIDTADGTIGSVFGGPNSSKLTRDANGIDGALWLQPRFDGADRDSVLQQWIWDSAAGMLRWPVPGTNTSHCLEVVPPTRMNVNVWARQLRNGSIALVFVNAERRDAKVTVECTWSDCLRNLPGLSETETLVAYDLVDEDVSPYRTVAKDGVAAKVEGGGGSVTMLLIRSGSK